MDNGDSIFHTYITLGLADAEGASLRNESIYMTANRRKIPLISDTDIPVVSMTTTKNGVPSHVSFEELPIGQTWTSLYRRHVVSVAYPVTHDVNEVQTLTCESSAAILGEVDLSMTLTFRGYSTRGIWQHAFVTDDLYSQCRSSSSRAIFNSKNSVICGEEGDYNSLQAYLEALETITAVEVETNSTTGRICPSLEDMDEEGNRAVFSTNITFKRSPSVKGVKDSVTIAPSTTGDVPTIVVQLSAESNLTSVTVSETTKGVTDDVREVQVFRIAAKTGTNEQH